MEEKILKEYEIGFLLESADAEKVLADVLAKNGAEVFNQKAAAEIPLAYPIKKHETAYFGFCHFRCTPDVTAQIDAALRLAKPVLRYLIITPPVKSAVPQPATRPVRKAPELALSNAALEEKLEEILK